VFVSTQFVLVLLTFAMSGLLALALAATFVGFSRLSYARSTGETAAATTVVLLVSGGWTLCVLGLAMAIVLGIAGYGLIDGVIGNGGD
jgi:hypothetical protein